MQVALPGARLTASRALRYPLGETTFDRASLNDAIHIAAACDERYAMPLAAMLASIGRHLGADRRVVVHVLASRVSEGVRRKVEHSVRAHPIEIRWLAVPAERFDSLRDTLRSFDSVSIESYYRLLLPELLPAELRKVLYLDCDVVLNHDVGDLWEADVEGTCLLAAAELAPEAQLVSSEAGIRYHREVGLAPDLAFFNSGVLLLNLERIRKGRIMQRAFDYLEAAKPHLRWHDQEALNVAVAGDWRPLDPRWNVTMHLFREGAAAQRDDLLRDPFLVHYNSAVKPWQAEFPFGFRDLFFEALDATAWSGWRPAPPRFGGVTEFTRKVLRAIRKRRHAFAGTLREARLQRHRARVLDRPLAQLDPNPVPVLCDDEVRVFLVCERVDSKEWSLVARYLSEGADRALVAAPSFSALPATMPSEVRERVHLFSTEGDTRSRHEVLRHLLHRHGTGHWCLLDESGAILEQLGSACADLRDLCRSLERNGLDALRTDAEEATAPSPREFARDPLTGCTFACAASPGKIALIEYRRDLSLSEDLRAVYGARIADR